MTDWALITKALRQRGFEIAYNVRVTGFGDRKISVIKAVRELTGWGLAVTKEAVESFATILGSLPLDAAERAAEELQAAGATVEIGADELHRFAYDPDHPLRGNQPIERVRVVARGIALERGKLGDWTLAPIEPLDFDSMLDAIDQHRRRWAAAGKHEAASEQEIHALTSARNRSLEARLRDSDSDEARTREAAVYGDWLQAHGDPRGLIAAASLSLTEVGEVAALRDERQRELDRLVVTHSSHLFGPARETMDFARWTWHGPVLDTLRVGLVHQPGLAPRPPTFSKLITLLGTPVCACLRSLALEGSTDRDLLLGDVLNATGLASSLHELRIGGAIALRLHGDAFTRLQSLTLAGRFTLGPARLPSLRQLDLDIVPIGPLRETVVELDTPALEEFSIRLNTHDRYDPHYGLVLAALFELLSQPAFAKLRRLKLATVPLEDGFAHLLPRIPAIATLDRIDLREATMSEACRAELERSRDRLPGLLLDR